MKSDDFEVSHPKAPPLSSGLGTLDLSAAQTTRTTSFPNIVSQFWFKIWRSQNGLCHAILYITHTLQNAYELMLKSIYLMKYIMRVYQYT